MHISKYILKISSKQIHRTLEIGKDTITLKVLSYFTAYDIKIQNIIPQDQIMRTWLVNTSFINSKD